MTEFYNNSWNYIVKKLKSDIYSGLKSSEIEERRKYFGKNTIETVKTRNLFKIVISELGKLWVGVLLTNIALSIYLKHIFISFILIFILIISIGYGVVKKYHREKSLKDLEHLNTSNARVIRDSRIITVKCEELVIGDIVLIERNSIIPGDLRIIESENLKIKESAVTGENYAAEKYQVKIEEKEINLADMKNIAFKGTQVVSGEGLGIVISTGMNTKIGGIVKLINNPSSPMENLVQIFSRVIGKLYGLVLLIALIFGATAYNQGIEINRILNQVEEILLAGIPQLLIITFVAFLLKIGKDLEHKNIIIKDISILNYLPKINYIFMDKIGGLSKNEVVIKKAYTNGKTYDISEKSSVKELNIERIISIGLLCNNSYYDSEKNYSKGNMFEIALWKFSNNNSFDYYDLEEGQIRLFEIPYDSEKRIMTTVNRVDSNYRANVKGAVDILLDRCTHIMKDGIEKELSIEEIDMIRQADIDLSEEGLVTLGFAYRSFTYQPSRDENIESNLVFVGILGFENPLNEHIKEELNYCNKQGIRVAFSTEDNKLSAYSLSKEVGFSNSLKSILTGTEMDYMYQKDLQENMDGYRIFSRISGGQKLKVVKVLKDKGYAIATSGSNLTEFPAMNLSHISIALGENSSNFVKKMSDLQIHDNYLKKFVYLLKYSNVMMENINRTISFALTVSITNIIMLLFSFNFLINDIYNKYMIFYTNGVILPLCAFLIFTNEGNYKNNFDKISINKKIILSKNITKNILNSLICSLFIFLGYYIFNSLGNETIAIINSFILMSFIYVISAFDNFNINKKLLSYIIMSIVLFIILGIVLLNILFNIKINLLVICLNLLIISTFYMFNKIFLKKFK